MAGILNSCSPSDLLLDETGGYYLLEHLFLVMRAISLSLLDFRFIYLFFGEGG